MDESKKRYGYIGMNNHILKLALKDLCISRSSFKYLSLTELTILTNMFLQINDNDFYRISRNIILKQKQNDRHVSFQDFTQ